MHLDESQGKDGDGDNKYPSPKEANAATRMNARKSVISSRKGDADKKTTTPQMYEGGRFNRISTDEDEEEEESDDDYKDGENPNDHDAIYTLPTGSPIPPVLPLPLA